VLGNALLEILLDEQVRAQISEQNSEQKFVGEQKFEKYFSALLAHEFSHFKLNHEPVSILKREIDADTFAAILIDDPYDLVCAHIFGHLVFDMAQFFKEKMGFDESKTNRLIASVMSTYVDLSPDFGRFTQCSNWSSVDYMIFEALMKVDLNSDVKFLANALALGLVDVSDKAHSLFNKYYLKILGQRLKSFFKHPFDRDTHPSPKQLLSLCKKLVLNNKN
jgi:hypothetical protein